MTWKWCRDRLRGCSNSERSSTALARLKLPDHHSTMRNNSVEVPIALHKRRTILNDHEFTVRTSFNLMTKIAGKRIHNEPAPVLHLEQLAKYHYPEATKEAWLI